MPIGGVLHQAYALPPTAEACGLPRCYRCEPHFDRLYTPDQRKEWLGQDYTYEDARHELLSNWREYADEFFDNHY